MSSNLIHSKSISVRGTFDTSVYDETHAVDLLNSLHRNKKYCDVTLQTDDGVKFPVHRCVMGCSSEYFDQQFTKQGSAAGQTVQVKGMSSEIMEILINFVYTSVLTITDENVYELYAAANHMELKVVKGHCNKYLFGDLKAESYLEVYDKTLEHGLDDVREKLVETVSNKLCHNRDDLANLPPPAFHKIVEIRNRKLVCEDAVYLAVIDWVKADYQSRSKHFKLLFQKLDVEMFPRKFLKQVVLNEGLVRTCNSCLNIVVDSLAKGISTSHTHCKEGPNKGSGSGFLVFTKESSIHKFNVEDKSWHEIYKNGFDRKETTVAFLNNCLYVIGGCDLDGSATAAVSKICLKSLSKGWEQLKPMRTARRHCGATTINGLIYVVGGTGEEGEILSSAEVYDPSTDCWSNLPSMSFERSHPTIVASQDYLFAMAGTDMDDEKLQSVERFHTKTNVWKVVSPIPMSKLYGPSAVSIKGHIYLIATIGLQASLEALQYNPKTDSWTQLASYHLPYLYTSACAVQGKIYLIDKWRKGDEIAIFDPEANSWTTIISQKKLGFRVRASFPLGS